MGWRGVLRSMVAASNANARQTRRVQNAAARAHSHVDRTLGQLDAEIERDVEKIAKLEAKIYEKPISASGMWFEESTGKWWIKKLADDKGKVQWSANIGYESDPIRSTGAVSDGSRVYQLLACTVTRLAVYMAIRVHQNGTAAKATKLFSKTDSGKNRVFLLVNGNRYQAKEGTLDVTLFGQHPEIGLVAFPLPDCPVQNAAIYFYFSGGEAQIGVQFNDPEVFRKAAAGPSLTSQIRDAIVQQYAPVRQHADAVRKEIDRKTKTGCVLVLGMIAFSGVASVTATVFALSR